MATTIFGLTPNNTSGTLLTDVEAQGYPLSAGSSHDAIDRYSKIGATERYVYPHEYNDSAGFNIPYIYFKFTDAFGKRIQNSPRVSIKLPSNLNLTGFSDYARTENIFGVTAEQWSNSSETGILDQAILGKQMDIDRDNSGGNVDGIAALKKKVAEVGVSAAEAFQYSWKRAIADLEGWGASAGLSNTGQYEFMNRQAVNPMAQLLYRGPQMRRYQLPFPMHPKSKKESEQIQKILSIFRVASAPSVPSTSGTSLGGVNIGVGNAFTFGYPHLTQFDVLFTAPDNSVNVIFRSKLCAIESVSVDYGSQKMTFFEDGTPTEIALTLQLTEVTPRTLGDEYLSSGNEQITLK